jgi:hypothetical protein
VQPLSHDFAYGHVLLPCPDQSSAHWVKAGEGRRCDSKDRLADNRVHRV